MNDLQDAFVDAIDHLDLPEVDLVAAVMEQVAGDAVAPVEPEPTAVGDALPRLLRPVLLAAAAMLAAAVIAVTTPVGEAVADWFGIGSTAFEVDETVDDDTGDGAPVTATTEAPTETRTGAGSADFGRPVVPVPEIVPIESLGHPDAVFDDERRGRTYEWNVGGRDPIRLSVRSTVNSTLSVKSLAAEDDVEFFTLQVPNEPFAPRSLVAAWIGAPHTLTYPVDGLDLEIRVDAGPVLIWVEDDLELRLEGAQSRDEAVQLATETVEGTELLPTE